MIYAEQMQDGGVQVMPTFVNGKEVYSISKQT